MRVEGFAVPFGRFGVALVIPAIGERIEARLSRLARRPRSEAIGEASMGLAAAAGAPAAGLVVALGGFTTTWVAGALAGAVILARTRRRP